MDNTQSGGHAGPPRKNPVSAFWLRHVAKIKRYFHERRAKRKKETSQDRFSRRTANATVAIAVLTLAVACVGALQYKILDQSDKTARLRDRAFISVDSLEIIPGVTDANQVIIWYVNPIAVNNGSTPTKNMFWTITIGKDGSDKVPPGTPPPTSPRTFPSLTSIHAHENMLSGFLGPKSRVTNFTMANGFLDKFLKDEPADARPSFVFGAFEYGDVYESEAGHVTEFCFIIGKPLQWGNSGQTLPYVRCRRHNCTDEECKREE